MAVKRCPNCGDLYLAAVDVCAECGTSLVEVDEQSDAGADTDAEVGGSGIARSDRGDQTVWELDSWTMEGRRLLDGMLAGAEIPRAWQGASLVAPASVRERVEEMVEVVARGDARVGIDDGTLAATDAGALADDTVGYEVSDWAGEVLDRLEERLGAEQIAYGWDEDGDLVVAGVHEERVDAIFAELSDGAVEPDDDDGPEALETLSQLFIASDSLARNPMDGNAARALSEATARLATHRLPFGFAPKVWESIIDNARSLNALIDSGELDDDAVEEAATALRATVREYV